jgi:FAD/FMN-containing dehydrogenase
MTTDAAMAGLVPGTTWRNWGRSESIRPLIMAAPSSVEQVAAIVRFAREREFTVKTVGAGHSFSPIALAQDVQLDLSGLEGILGVDVARARVTLGAGTTLHRLPALLAPNGLALENMGDIDRQTIAGATSTGTHGTGARFRGLAAQITAVTLVTADAAILRVSETENSELLPAARLGLGALGVIVDLTVQCVPEFLLHAVERVMTKSNTRLPGDAQRRPVGPIAGWFEDRLVANGVLAMLCNVGRLAPAVTPSINRLATRVYGNRTYTDRSHEVFVSPRTTRFREMEYAIPRAAIPAALRELRALIDSRGWSISFPVEVRVAAADDNWLSTAQGRDTGYIAVHRHFREDPEEYFRAVEQVMRAHQGRPHWGKIHYQRAESLAALYPHHADFVAVRDRLDPDRMFSNADLDRVLGP